MKPRTEVTAQSLNVWSSQLWSIDEMFGIYENYFYEFKSNLFLKKQKLRDLNIQKKSLKFCPSPSIITLNRLRIQQPFQ